MGKDKLETRMKDYNKLWYNKGFQKGLETGQRTTINIKNGEIVFRNDNMAFMLGEMHKNQEIRDAISEIESYKSKYNNQEYGQSYAIKAVNDVLRIIKRHTGVKE